MKNNIKYIISSLFVMIAFFLNKKAIYLDIHKIKNPFTINVFILGILYILFIFIYKKSKDKKIYKTNIILSILFSIFNIIGDSYVKLNNWDLIFSSPLLFFISIISFIGYFIFFNTMFKYVNYYLDKLNIKEINPKNNLIKKFIELFNNKPFITSLIVILIFYLPYIIAYYPIILSPDPSFQIKQFFNVHTKYADWVNLLDPNVFMTRHHPVIHTLLLGNCIKLGRFLINDNFGLFIYSIIQILFQSITAAYSIKFLKKYNVSIKLRLIVLLIYSIVPMFPFYALSGVKDTIYTNLIIIYIMFIYDFIKNKNEKINLKKLILLFVDLILICLFRNNGLYVIILSLPVLALYLRKNTIPLFIVLILMFTSYQVYNNVILNYFKISPGSIREVLSIPFQQTARDVKENKTEYSKKDKEIIDKILEFDTLEKRYNPNLADPVKNKYNKDATNDDLIKYLNVWFKHLLISPDTYVQATINNTYGYIYPNTHNWYIYTKFDKRITEDNLVNYSFNNLESLRNLLGSYGVVFPFIPLIGLLSNIGFNSWILFILVGYSIIKDKKEFIIVLLPGLVSLLICFASPANTYFRYTMPYVFSMPLVFTLFINEIKKNVH